MRNLRSRKLKEHFGTEYDRALLVRGDRSKAEEELINREKRVHSFSLRLSRQKRAAGTPRMVRRFSVISSMIPQFPLWKPIPS